MRKLTIKQKKILYQQVIQGIWNWDELPLKVIEEIEAINDTEILYQEANRYLNDVYWKLFLRGGE